MLADRLARHHETRTQFRQRLAVSLAQRVQQQAASAIAECLEHRIGPAVIVIVHAGVATSRL